jgi:hypothetical protein
MKTKNWKVGGSERHYLYYTKIHTKIKILKVNRQNPLVVLVMIIGSQQKALGNGQSAQIFQKAMGNLKILFAI